MFWGLLLTSSCATRSRSASRSSLAATKRASDAYRASWLNRASARAYASVSACIVGREARRGASQGKAGTGARRLAVPRVCSRLAVPAAACASVCLNFDAHALLKLGLGVLNLPLGRRQPHSPTHVPPPLLPTPTITTTTQHTMHTQSTPTHLLKLGLGVLDLPVGGHQHLLQRVGGALQLRNPGALLQGFI